MRLNTLLNRMRRESGFANDSVIWAIAGILFIIALLLFIFNNLN